MKDVIESLYAAFSQYSLKHHIEGCPCCGIEINEKKLHSKNLRSLSWDELGLFTFKSMTTYGDLFDFKHFLPRIVELYVQGFYEAPYDICTLFSKLKYANWSEWNPCERRALVMAIQTWIHSLAESGFEADREILNEIQESMEIYGFQLSDSFLMSRQ